MTVIFGVNTSGQTVNHGTDESIKFRTLPRLRFSERSSWERQVEQAGLLRAVRCPRVDQLQLRHGSSDSCTFCELARAFRFARWAGSSSRAVRSSPTSVEPSFQLCTSRATNARRKDTSQKHTNHWDRRATLARRYHDAFMLQLSALNMQGKGAF